MSTYYYNFRPPVGTAVLKEGPGHDRVRIYDRTGAMNGELAFLHGTGEAREFLHGLADADPCLQDVNVGNGKVESRQLRGFTGSRILSDHGETVRVEEVQNGPDFIPLQPVDKWR